MVLEVTQRLIYSIDNVKKPFTFHVTIRAAKVLRYMLEDAYICYLKTREDKGRGKTASKKKKPTKNKPSHPFSTERTLKAAHTV